jgi:hypothetical protein
MPNCEYCKQEINFSQGIVYIPFGVYYCLDCYDEKRTSSFRISLYEGEKLVAQGEIRRILTACEFIKVTYPDDFLDVEGEYYYGSIHKT